MNNSLQFTEIVYRAVTEASQYRVWGNDEASLEGGSALDPCQLRSRSSSSGRSHQEYLHFPRRGGANLVHSTHGWCILLSHVASVPGVSWRHRDWQPTDSSLGVLPWHGCDNAWLASCSKRGGMAAQSRINPRHDPMVLRLWQWQGDLCTFPVILLCHNVTLSHWPPRGTPTVHARWFQRPACSQGPFDRIQVD